MADDLAVGAGCAGGIVDKVVFAEVLAVVLGVRLVAPIEPVRPIPGIGLIDDVRADIDVAFERHEADLDEFGWIAAVRH